MELHEQLAANFKAYCENQKKILDDSAKTQRASGDEWECVKTKIKFGIAELAHSSISTIHALVCGKTAIPEKHWIRNELDVDALKNDSERFFKCFMAFLGKVSTPWMQSLEQAKKRNDAELIDKENVKLSYVSELSDRFTKMYAELNGGTSC